MGTGGMRFGAGRPGNKIKSENTKRLTIVRWHREGYLEAGRSFSWSWTCEGHVTGTIGVRAYGDALMLDYSLGSGDAKRDASQRISIERTPCNFGKTRPWFVCPRCNRRSGVLFLRWGRFACRHCQRVAYASQSSDAMGRAWLKQAKIEARLGDDWTRPSR